MSGPPRLSLHVGDYLKDTPPVSRVNWEHHGIYLLALMVCWNVPHCRLPDEDAWLAERFGCTVDELQKFVRPILSKYFKRRGSWLTQKRLKVEFTFISESSEKQSNRAKSGWNKRKNKSRGIITAIPEQVSGNAPLSPSPSLPLSTAVARDGDLETKLRKAAGWERESHPNLSIVGPIEQLIAQGSDLLRDVLPVVKALAPKARRKTSWNYFVDAIAEATLARKGAGAKLNGHKRTPLDWHTFDHEMYAKVVRSAKQQDKWPAEFGPIDKIPPDLMDDELRRICERRAH